jgi:environmental stress-induced protein Ves
MSALIRHLKPADYRVMPWKNGGGSTTEIAVDPPGAAVGAAFRWRLSLATIERAGPFSAFPGYDRSIMLVAGPGMELDFGGHGGARLERPFEPVRFSGDWPTASALIGGACEDFNIMTERASLSHRLAMSKPGRETALAADTLAIVCFAGWVAVAGAGEHRLERVETLIAEGAGRLRIHGPGLAAVVAIDRVRVSAAGTRPEDRRSRG